MSNLAFFYSDLETLLSTASFKFPQDKVLRKNYNRVTTCQNDRTLFDELSPSITKSLVDSFYQRNTNSFFGPDFDKDTPSFVTFVGGREFFMQLDTAEQLQYWGTKERPSLIGRCLQYGLSIKANGITNENQHQHPTTDTPSFTKTQSKTILLSFYKDLYVFLSNLVIAFPKNTLLSTHLDKVRKSRDSVSFDTFETLSESFNKDFLVSFLKHDVDTFFTNSSPFINFLGGRAVFELLDDEGKRLYWGNDENPSLINTCIRHGLNLQSLQKNATLLDSCMGMFPRSATTGTTGVKGIGDLFTTIKNTVKPEGMLDTISQLINDKDGIHNAVDMLQSLLVSTTMDTPTAQNYTKTNDKKDGVDSSNDDTIDSEKDTHIEGPVLPSTIFKKENKRRKKVTSEKENQFPESMSGLLDQMGSFDLTSIQEEIKEALHSGDLKDMVDSVCEHMDPQTILEDIQNGSVDFSKFVN